MKYSFCTTVYNSGEIIGEFLKSMSELLDNNSELVIVDNLSIDGTAEALESFASNNINVSVIRKYIPENVVETGVAQGVSSRFILEALKDNNAGKLTSIDLPNYNPKGQINRDGQNDSVFVKKELGVGWIVPDSLRGRWNLLLGDSKEILRNLDVTPDIFFHDSDHSYEHMTFEFEWAYDHLTSEGFIVSDDINWNKSFEDFIGRHKNSVKKLYSKFGTGVAKLTSAN